jgi:hypothetical protein
MPSYPFAIGTVVHRSKDWTVFSEVDGAEPLSVLR